MQIGCKTGTQIVTKQKYSLMFESSLLFIYVYGDIQIKAEKQLAEIYHCSFLHDTHYSLHMTLIYLWSVEIVQ